MQLIDTVHYEYLLHLFDTSTEYDVHELLKHSQLHMEERWYPVVKRTYVNLKLLTDPEIFKKYQGSIGRMSSSIMGKFIQITGKHVQDIKCVPDLTKFRVLRNQIVEVLTPWEEINQDQGRIINQLRDAVTGLDFQNVGNSARTVLQKLAGKVFDPNKHVSSESGMDLSEGKFKNRLDAYFSNELDGEKELRDFALSMITGAKKSIDVANTLTHKLNADYFFAEAAVISTITVISIVKLVESRRLSK